MKKLLLTALIASMLILPLGSVALADDTEAPCVDNADYVPGSIPAQNYVDSMAPALHAVLLAMENQGVTAYTTDNDALSWEMLYNLVSMYGQMDDRSAYEGELLILPAETVMDYSAALFSAPLDAAGLPGELTDRMTYDPNQDEYRLCCGSDSLSEVRITSAEDLGTAVAVTGSLVYLPEELELARFTATLNVTDNLFGYSIAELNVD